MADLHEQLQETRGRVWGSVSSWIAAKEGKLYAEHCLDRAIQAAERQDRESTADWLRTARLLLADQGSDPEILNPAFQILGKAANGKSDA
ncbi:hypothetical protein [Thiohalorhabdus sp.]|uniref:hypothetical protein n=1 Tax=Thiohalorhabdus sp. TaxID=3094134 RepID=UPI002FC2A97A